MTPRLSIIVIVYRMRRQAMNTLYSLSAAYQRDVLPQDYEVLVLENSSDQNLEPAEVAALGHNFHYTLREESRSTPVYAVNEGISRASGQHICLMVDGARMLSPRVVCTTLLAIQMNPKCLVAVPGYHIGDSDHGEQGANDNPERTEVELLDATGWRDNGYRLLAISVLSGANPNGFLHPLLESNCLTVPSDRLRQFGGAHEGFQTPGGGAFNLDLYRGLAQQTDLQLFVLPGEGSFHQYHGGVTTRERSDRDVILARFREEYAAVRGEPYQAVRREPTLLGPLAPQVLPFIQHTVAGARKRFRRFQFEQRDPWQDD